MSVDKFKGIDNDINRISFDEMLEDNVISYIDWSFINAGAYNNVTIPASGTYGGDFSLLYQVDDPRVADNTVYRSVKKPLVWESGVERGNPIAISGVYVDGVFTDDVDIDYRNGTFTFSSITTGSVRCEYSYKWINVISADRVPWLRTVQRSFRVDENIYSASGQFSSLPMMELQLPAVAVEITDTQDISPYQLGGGQVVNKNVSLYIIAEDTPTSKRISSILEKQVGTTLFMYDTNLMVQNSGFPLNYNGELNDGAKTYPQLIKTVDEGGYRTESMVQNGKFRIIDSSKERTQQIKEGLYQTPVTWVISSILPKI